MKTVVWLMVFIIIIFVWVACKNKARYLDLNTGKRVELVKDSNTGMLVRVDTREPVEIYVDTKTHDTIYGSTGKVINGHLVKTKDGKYKYDEDSKMMSDDEYKVKDGDYKKKVEKDGDVKIKVEDTKVKIDGKTGEKKVKDD